MEKSTFSECLKLAKELKHTVVAKEFHTLIILHAKKF